MSCALRVLPVVLGLALAGCGSKHPSDPVCEAGYEVSGSECVDIDECAAGTAGCAASADCANTPGSFTCTCRAGYSGDGFTCTDVDECTLGTDDCGENAECTDTEGGFACACSDGFTGDGHTCTDVDECQLGTHDCSEHADCANTVGGFTCTCQPGYGGDGVTCDDITHWIVVGGMEGSISLLDTDTGVMHGPYLQGQLGSTGSGLFDLVVTPDGLTAIASSFGDSRVYFIDLSDLTAPALLGSVQLPMFAEDVALSADGRFALVTDGGFNANIVSLDVASRTIVDVARPAGVYANAVTLAPDGTVITANYFNGAIDTHVLDADGLLTYANTYHLYVRASGDATDNDQAHAIRPVNVAVAPDGQTVLVTDVSPYNDITVLDPDVDLAIGFARYAVGVYRITAPGVLEFASVVSSLPRAVQSLSFNAAGDTAYLLGNAGLDRGDLSGVPSAATNDLLSVLTIASPGVVSFDAARSANLNRYCSSSLFGVDNIVVHRGQAYVSYSTISIGVDLRVITRVDLETFEVTRIGADGIPTGLAVVPVQTLAVPVPVGTPTCEGICGGANKEQHCFCDLDCLKFGDCCPDLEPLCGACDPTTCTYPRSCVNSAAGDYLCTCPTEYLDDGSGGCLDIDECTEGTANCAPEATCVNYDGGYYCQCSAPFMADGNGLCVCNPGYLDDGSGGCVDRDECVEQNPCLAPATCTNSEGSYTCDCVLPLVSDGLDGCVCQPPQVDDGVGGCTACMQGYVEDGSGGCLDLDECAEGIDTCNGTATCTNYDGGYTCDCPPSFVPNGTQGCRCPAGYEDDGLGSCLEIDECALGTDGCNGLATCTNYAGGYRCDCPPPLVPDNSRGCRCPTGFEDDGLGGCVDLDECALGTDNCSTHADCTNTDGGFTCACQAGYTGSGRLCAPI